MSTKILFIGQLYNEELINQLLASNSKIDFASDTFQKSIIHGLRENNCDVKVASFPRISSFPNNRIIFKRSEWISSNKNDNVIQLGFINLPILKHISKIVSLRRFIKKQVNNGNILNIIIYSVHSPFLLALYGIKTKAIKTCLIVPDLPQYMSSSKNILYRFAKRIDINFIRFGLKYIDCYILLSPLMKEMLPIKKDNYEIIEGIYKEQEVVKTEFNISNNYILYSGSLDHRYGIIELVEAFNKLTDIEIELYICGAGDTEALISEYSNTNNKIKYFGSLPRKMVLYLQKNAKLLINPRNNTDAYTKYSFPSKTMEYMASGTPVLMSKLKSLPDDYLNHLYFFDSTSPDGIKSKIQEILSLPETELNTTGLKAQAFIKEQKNEIVQSFKLLSLLNNTCQYSKIKPS